MCLALKLDNMDELMNFHTSNYFQTDTFILVDIRRDNGRCDGAPQCHLSSLSCNHHVHAVCCLAHLVICDLCSFAGCCPSDTLTTPTVPKMLRWARPSTRCSGWTNTRATNCGARTPSLIFRQMPSFSTTTTRTASRRSGTWTCWRSTGFRRHTWSDRQRLDLLPTQNEGENRTAVQDGKPDRSAGRCASNAGAKGGPQEYLLLLENSVE